MELPALFEFKDADPPAILEEQCLGNSFDFGEMEASDNETQASNFLDSLAKKSAVSSDSTDGSRKLPLAEKAARLEEQRKRLAGLEISDEMTPSHVDRPSNHGDGGQMLAMDSTQQVYKKGSGIETSCKGQQQIPQCLGGLKGSVVLARMPEVVEPRKRFRCKFHSPLARI